MTKVYFFYGLAFLIMGGMVFAMPKKFIFLNISEHFWLLGIFGVAHGINEWVDLLIFRGGPFDVALLRIIAGALLPISFIFLNLFAWRVISSQKARWKWLNLILPICFLLWALTCILSRQLFIMNIAARYFLALPGALLAAFGLCFDFINSDKAKRPWIISVFELLAVIAFICYGLLAGLVVPKANFLCAALINYETFSQFFGFPVQFFRMLCAIILAVSFYILAGVFYYEKGRIIFKGGIRRKTLLLISLITCIVIGIGISLGYLRGVNLLQNVIGQEHKAVSVRLSSSVSDILNEKVNVIKTYLTETIFKDALRAANQRYQYMQAQAIEKFLLGMDKKWISARLDSPLVNEYLNSPASLRLNKISKSDQVIGEIFITDKFGGLVISSDKTSDFYQADEDWWRQSYYSGKGRIYLGDIEYDESSKIWAVPVSIPIKEDSGELIGICKAVLDIDKLFAPLARVQLGQSGCAVLLNEQGDILFQKGVVPYTAKFLSPGQIAQLLNSKEVWKVVAGTVKGQAGKRLVTLKMVSLPFFGKSNSRWVIAILTDLNEVYAPIRELFAQMLIFFFVLMVVLLPLEFVLGNIFVKPITELNSAVERIIAGDTECSINIKTADEIEWLGESFMIMVQKVREEQARLLNEKAYSLGIVASMADALIVVNPDATLKSVNKATLDLLGYREDELIGQPMKKIFLQEEEEEEEERVLHKYFQKIIDEGVAYNIGLTFFTKQGKGIPVNFSGAAMRQDGKIIGIVGVARDMRQIMAIISDLQKKDRDLEERSENLTRMQRAMLHMMDDLQDASRVRAQFTGMVSHELRTPLAAIKEGVSVVLDKIVGGINEEQQKYLDIAKKNVDRLDRLISGVLDFQRLESGKMEFKMEENDINEVVKEIRQAMLPVAEKKNLDFVCQLDEGLLLVEFDRDKIIQVLTNLTNNALKFTDKGSITIATGKGDNFIQVAVKDTGQGIKEEDMPKLFQQFTQLQRKVGGTGLGLSICKQIIKAHKGEIWAESEFGKGAAFYFTIPEKLNEKKKIGEILIEEGKINEEDLKKALEKQEKQE